MLRQVQLYGSRLETLLAANEVMQPNTMCPQHLRIDIETSGWSYQYVEIPHKPFDEVFHEAVLSDSALLDDEAISDSAFVAGLAEMLARKTDTAAGLMVFLEMNLEQFEEAVAKEIVKLAKEVTGHVN